MLMSSALNEVEHLPIAYISLSEMEGLERVERLLTIVKDGRFEENAQRYEEAAKIVDEIREST